LGAAVFLERYPAVRSRDAEFARDRLFNIYGADGFDTAGGDFGIHANYVRLSSLGLGFCSYDSTVELSFPELDFVRQFFSIQGSANLVTAREKAPIGAWSAFVAADSRVRLDFAPGYRQLVLRIDVTALDRTLKSFLGDSSDKKLVFYGDAPDPAQMSVVRRCIFQLASELDRFGPDYSPLALAEMERGVIFRFALAHRHNFTDRLWLKPTRANVAILDRIEGFIEANWDKPVDIEQLARVAGVSARTVFREFAVAGRDSPAQFAKRVRLQRAAEFLSRADEHTSVTGVAFRCGFHNPGRFASDYARLIGELPSETLKRARRTI
jgi:AraC-like DNA-binding protein